MPTLYLIRGVPGAGKSSFAKALLEQGLVDRVYEADDYFYDGFSYRFDPNQLKAAHEVCQMQTRQDVSLGRNVAVSNTSVSEWEVGTYETIAIEFGAKFISVIVENRHGNSSIHNVPSEKVEQMKKRFSIKL